MTAVSNPWWGPWFPDFAGASTWFGPMFTDGVPVAGVIQPSTPGGSATFLLLESGSKITFSYLTDVRKMWSGKEYRTAILDDPKRTFVGSATLLTQDQRTMRSRLARYIAIGSTFLIALTYESLTITANTSGMILAVANTANSDWMLVGQRVAVVGQNGTSIAATIQAFTSNTITLDVAPGSLGNVGCSVMPTVPVFLDPQMAFGRYPVNVELWQLNARAAVFGYPITKRRAMTSLSVSTGSLHGMTLSVLAYGAAGNAYTITFVNDGGGGTLTHSGTAYTFHYQANVTTVQAAVIALGSVFFTSGTYAFLAKLLASDAVGPLSFSGGIDGGYGSMGANATVNTYSGRAVWDRGVQNQDTISDSIQSLAELVDMNGIPISIGTADQADWGRAVYFSRSTINDWQWIKKFLSTVNGRQHAWWMPSMRADLVPVGFGGVNPANGSNYLLVSGPGEIYGDLAAWWPSQRDRLQLHQTDGTITYAQILSVIDNHDGTLSLGLQYNSAPSGATVDLVSWLELVRFESDDFEFTFEGTVFTLQTQAHVVAQ